MSNQRYSSQSCAYQTLLTAVSHSCILEHPTSLLFLDVLNRPVPSSSSMLNASVIFCQVTQEPLSSTISTIYTKSKTVWRFGIKADFEMLNPLALVGIKSTIFQVKSTFTFFRAIIRSKHSMANFNRILNFLSVA